MTWTRLDDGFVDEPVHEELTYTARWHYLSLIQRCSRTHRYDGVLRLSDARRCSDVPDPDADLAALAAAGLVQLRADSVVLLRIEEHIPPPHVRDEHRKAGQRERKRRQREREKSVPRDVPREVTREVTGDVTRDIGTGQDGPGPKTQPPPRDERDTDTPWPPVVLASPSGPGRCPTCNYPQGRHSDDCSRQAVPA